MRKRIVMLTGAMLGAASVVVRSSSAQPAAAPSIADRPNQVTGDEITAAQQAAVERGLAWLASKQGADGSYGSGGGFQRHAGITALAGLAFMQNGNLPNRGRYGAQVRKCLDFVLASCQESGLVASDMTNSPMYGHGFATLFLGEVYGMTGDESVKEKLTKAVRLIERSQNAEGGWRYQPAPLDADISVTICQVMALRAARDAGIKVDRVVIDKSVAYVRACQNADGGFSYTARDGGGGSGFARSAAGVAALYYAGIFQGDDLERGLKYLAQFTPAGRPGAAGGGMGIGQPMGIANAEVEGHYFYGHYYAVQAMFLAGGDYWRTFYPALRDQLVQRQDKATGRWTDNVSDDYATSMALIILQMPNRYLPVYAGKGPGG
ncbi:MAG TPA: prenyltransferase/squalene oxidase repeat-containing protein [Tepidisphaeraceae bacterium]|nr:prenyltransferase/squalene oxidase repeat-containing protein [Tepidisphaeraceae bacterium]